MRNAKRAALTALLVASLLLCGCAMLSMPPSETMALPTSASGQTPAHEPAQTPAPQTPVPQTPVPQTPVPQGIAMPSLSEADYGAMRYFEDGIGQAALVKCFDGDTASFNIDGETHKVRFIAIDTPEVNSPYVDKEAWSDEAAAYTENLLEGARTIVLEMDDNADIADDYGRLIAWVWADGELVNALLVRDGYAEVKYLFGDYKYTDTLLELEREAKAQHIGMWRDADEAS